uniref:O-methyltransferase dimerisation domain-containing protein n=1 Tax=Opuntia streptacantha TaxID=393608 RepID=A0A7C8YY18_OPUST
MAFNAPSPHQNNGREEDELCSFALSIATSSSLLMVLKASIELDVIGIIHRAGSGAHLSSAQIAAQLPTKNPEGTASMLDRMLRILANNSILSCSLRAFPNDGLVERLYGLAPVCRFFAKPHDFGPAVLLLQEKVLTDTWCGAYYWRYVCECAERGCYIYEVHMP